MMLEHLVMTIQFVLVLAWGLKNDGAGPILMMQNVGVGTTMSLIWVGFHCESACVLTLQNFRV
jgi:hypothetical protein